jgi:hypothetical protein
LLKVFIPGTQNFTGRNRTESVPTYDCRLLVPASQIFTAQNTVE